MSRASCLATLDGFLRPASTGASSVGLGGGGGGATRLTGGVYGAGRCFNLAWAWRREQWGLAGRYGASAPGPARLSGGFP